MKITSNCENYSDVFPINANLLGAIEFAIGILFCIYIFNDLFGLRGVLAALCVSTFGFLLGMQIMIYKMTRSK